ncbi:type IX secretion system PorP/SprF family membrane protein [Flavobacterium croceum DSM 17960]|jgi:type IX secretion system PorP/SprF family membrane protein|uniref:Type IX secretion system PorP/SprF family membrane protein n=1 Tax=Flavobacterium croceum DSM 17960 TaxID=1121886 RepID=A0A2S4N4J3_9FLAO|nr:type IX secretion system membrane protein PorP/SprF [Flavobacterium croceum]POS00601.1 type IX secretion system PorP/SprF family membrane protein [Flavobacterium croceum DSM 17960]
MRKIFLTTLVLLASSYAIAQQDAQYTQYMYNTANINPAYAGSRGVLSVFGLHRTQWVGLDGAPVTNTLAISSPVANSRLGVGLSFVNDRIGPTSDNKISADISYTIPTSETYKLSFGVKGTAELFNFDRNKLYMYSSNDLALQSINNEFIPNVGAGVYLHSDKTYVGLSVPNFLQSKKYSDNDRAIYMDRMHYYLIGGHVFDVSSSVKFKPAFLAKVTEGAPLQLDLSGNFMFNDKFILGAAYRWSAAVSAMAGFQVTPGLYIGYGYDMETTKLANYNSGSHEVFLRFELFKNADRIVSPRFF